MKLTLKKKKFTKIKSLNFQRGAFKMRIVLKQKKIYDFKRNIKN